MSESTNANGRSTPALSAPVLLALGAGLFLLLLHATGARAQCGLPMCAGMYSPMGGMSCSITWMNPSPGCPGYLQPGICNNASPGANAYNPYLMAWVALAAHSPMQPPTATCSWGGFSEMLTTPPVGPPTPICVGGMTTTCIVTSADGLPVELMEFSVEPTAEAEAGPEDPPADPPDG